MSYRKKLDRSIAYMNWIAKKGFQEVQEFNIPEIPLTRELFPGREDYWQRLIHLENATNRTGFSYEPKFKSTFEPHVHPKHEEIVTFLQGSAIVYTPSRTVSIKKGESIILQKGEPHIFDFNEHDEDCKDKLEAVFMIVEYYPKMIGWSGTFLNE